MYVHQLQARLTRCQARGGCAGAHRQLHRRVPRRPHQLSPCRPGLQRRTQKVAIIVSTNNPAYGHAYRLYRESHAPAAAPALQLPQRLPPTGLLRLHPGRTPPPAPPLWPPAPQPAATPWWCRPACVAVARRTPSCVGREHGEVVPIQHTVAQEHMLICSRHNANPTQPAISMLSRTPQEQ